ncbi:chymotrypsin-2-like [Toxorhynchites rutilus septentrionalis]|uniref:chymotrypsin-2-like n=1 Tax=Toxorhynchites rutilus septentrionalis TaxID=329112 RepID=UPI00247AC575|nr:chymotrypsin-2-like [Toxorhynchites rutilus septentrionalis]
MLRHLVLACFISSTLGDGPPSNRIVGGAQAARQQFPFVAALHTQQGEQVCGAVIVSDRWILTAAHCTIGVRPHMLQVMVGSIDRTIGGQLYDVELIINHPDFNQFTLNNDIALLRTIRPIEMSTTVQPIKMGESPVLDGQIGTVSGWGMVDERMEAAVMLQFLDVRTLNYRDCAMRHNYHNANKIHSSSLCTTSLFGQGTCMGDSGGPLVVNHTVVGIVSWGVPCATGIPDVFTSVPSHRAWIRSTAGI